MPILQSKVDGQKFNYWLEKQYRGEVTAVGRIAVFAASFTEELSRERRILDVIKGQEQQHASWIKGLLDSRGIAVRELEEPQRYWDETLSSAVDFETSAAVASNAERMRLERIKLIAEDPEAPQDVREVFERILPQEIFHERAFRLMAGEEAMQATAAAHEAGVEAIGLIPTD